MSHARSGIDDFAPARFNHQGQERMRDQIDADAVDGDILYPQFGIAFEDKLDTTMWGELAAIGTAVCWSLTAVFFSYSGRIIGSGVVNRSRLIFALFFECPIVFPPTVILMFSTPSIFVSLS